MDRRFSLWINEPVGQWPLFDEIIGLLSYATLLKMGPLLALLVFLWFSRSATRTIRDKILAGLAGTIFSLFLAQLIQKFIWRTRPLQEMLEIDLPTNVARMAITSPNSFPSDTATLAFAISTTVFLQNRSLGLLAYAWSVLCVAFPRLYVGLHYLSDVVAGIIIGVATVYISTRAFIPKAQILMNTAERWPGISAAFGFLLFFSIGTMFDDLRDLASLLLDVF